MSNIDSFSNLFQVFKDSSSSEDQRKVAESILSFFSGFESFALSAPTDDVDIMQEIGKHWNDLSLKFREGVKNFEFMLKSKLVPKKSINQGEYVTGEGKRAVSCRRKGTMHLVKKCCNARFFLVHF